MAGFDGAWIRPEPIFATEDVQIVGRRDDVAQIAQLLSDGVCARIGDCYSTGMAILFELRRQLLAGDQSEDYRRSREFRAAYRQASQRLLAPVADHRIALRKAPSIGWLEELYPDISEFHLPFPSLQGLNSSWQWYLRGLQLPVLDHLLHPFYGTYFPTRFDHLELFAGWLQTSTGKRDFAFDIGTGCGVLALQLSQAGFEHVVATDTNPNAIESVRRDLARRSPLPAIEPLVADLFGDHQYAADLVVFNPPWLPGEPKGPLDRAMYFEDDLFDRFFAAAVDHMHADARLVMIFSNLIRQGSADAMHPIEVELASNSRFQLVQKLQQSVRASSKKTRRRKRCAGSERVELWELSR